MEDNLRKWFKDEDWVRIDTQGNIAGKCGTMKKGKKTTRCLPRKKAQSLTKKQRAATSRKKTASKKQYVKNTKKAKVSLKKESMDLKLIIFEALTEKLCKKGKAYVARRKAAGEKHGAYLMGRAVKVCKGQMSGKKKKKKNEELYEVYTIESIDEIQMIEDALNEEYCPSCAAKMENTAPNHDGKAAPYGSGWGEVSEKKGKCKPSKGKRFAKRVNGKCRSFGQKGKASDGGDRIRPGTKKAHAYCARSAKIKKCKNPPCANTLSRKKWKCQGSRSVPEGLINEQTSCDNSMAGSCAQNWLPSNYSWSNQTNFGCSGFNTFDALKSSMKTQVAQIAGTYDLSIGYMGFSNYSDISNWVNSTGVGQPLKGQLKRKIAKFEWASCMQMECNC